MIIEEICDDPLEEIKGKENIIKEEKKIDPLDENVNF